MPNLTSKEATALEEQLTAERLLVQKYRVAASSTNDLAMKTKFEQIASRHQGHYDKLVTFIH